MTRVKVCGITRHEDAIFCIASGVHALGFIFYEKSKRYIRPSDAKDIIRKLPPFVSRVGVFVNSSAEDIKNVSIQTGIDTVQLHGDETPEFCDFIKKPVIKSFRVKDSLDISHIESFNVQAILFDTYDNNNFGGTGKVFNWDIIKNYNATGNIIISGGLNKDNVGFAIKNINPYAVDVSSGVESSPGIKDHLKINKFMESVRNAR